MARSGVCPTVPQRDRNSYNDVAPSRDEKFVPVPDAAFSVCLGSKNIDTTVPARPGGSAIVVEKCCPSPGPAGPQGDAGIGVPIGGTASQVISKIDGTDYNTEWRDTHEVPTGGLANEVLSKLSDNDYDYDWTQGGGGGTGDLVWRAYWQEGVTYFDNEIVSHKNSSFVCNIEHLSEEDNQPDGEFDKDPGGFEWSLMSHGAAEEDQGLIDGLIDSTGDWLSDIENWGLADYALLALAGVGLIWAGSQLVDMFDADGSGDGEANSSYNGDAVYTGVSTPPTLQELVAKMCEHAGVTTYNVSLLPTIQTNIALSTLTSARDAMQMLSRVYFFDMIDSAGQLQFIPRAGKTPVRTLTELQDLGYNKSDAGTSPVAVKRYQSIDLPRVIQLQYISEAQNYNNMTQEATLEAFVGGQDTKITVPITLTEEEAYNTAEKLLINSHIERTNYSFTTTYNNIDLEPSDIITVENVGDVRILRIDESDEGLLDIQTVAADFNVENYIASGLPAETPPINTDVPIVIGYSAGLAVELPPLDFTDIEQRLTLFPHGYGANGWPGCAIYLSIDGGVSYSQFTTTTKETTWGKVTVPTPTISNYFVWDETTTITVQLKSGTLSSKPASDVYNLSNWCLIGQEVIGFKTATLVAIDTYEISGLLRGRRGSEFHIGGHVADEVFILLDEAAVELPYSIADKEKVVYIKYVTNGSDVSKATAYQAQPSQLSRRPWMVSHLEAIKVGNDWNITWIGRNQFNSDMVDGSEVTNPDGFRGYNIGFVGTGSPQIKRNVITQAADYIYTEAEQIADFGSVQTTLQIQINQLDQFVGVGYVVEKTFT